MALVRRAAAVLGIHGKQRAVFFPLLIITGLSRYTFIAMGTTRRSLPTAITAR